MIDPKTLRRILKDMRDLEDVDRAVAASTEYGRLATSDDIPRLRRLMARGDYFFRECMGETLAWLDGARSLPLLLRVLREGQAAGHDHDGLTSAISGWVGSHPADAAPVIRKLLAGKKAQDRTDGAWLAGFAAGHVDYQPVLAATHDPEPLVRAAAIGSLTEYRHEPGVYDRLVAALDDPDEHVVGSAISSLGYLGDRRALAHLRRFTKGRHRHLATYAVEQLEKAG